MVAKKRTAKKTPDTTPAKATPVAESRKMKPHEIVLSPTLQNAVGISSWGKFAGEANLQELLNDLREQVAKVQAGDMTSVEAMLYGQAMTLQTMFTSLTRQAANETGLKQYQAKLTFALKAQAQCRSTLEALAEIKNPRPVSFVRQANYAAGPQQVNNGNVPGDGFNGQSHAHAAKSESQQNKLLEADHGQRMDIGTQGAASRVNQAVEAVV